MTDLKRNEVLSFDDGLLTVKMEGHGRANGWGVLTFHERQIEVDADGYHSVEIPPTELRELHDFLGRVLALSAAPGEPCAVKPLEWRDGPYATETIVADSIFGQYTAWYIEPHGLWQSPTTHAGTICGNSLSAAKAAAQADYEKRIRSALVTTPQPAAGWDEAQIEAAARAVCAIRMVGPDTRHQNYSDTDPIDYTDENGPDVSSWLA